jgi:hypothetical protein
MMENSWWIESGFCEKEQPRDLRFTSLSKQSVTHTKSFQTTHPRSLGKIRDETQGNVSLEYVSWWDPQIPLGNSPNLVRLVAFLLLNLMAGVGVFLLTPNLHATLYGFPF